MSDTIIAILLSPFLIAALIDLWKQSSSRTFDTCLDVVDEGRV
jgi:hypothetical protein